MAALSSVENIGDFVVHNDLDNFLGQGICGKVYKGHHVRTKREVAAKIFLWEKKYVSEETDREAENLMNIPEHENVIRILDYIKKDIPTKTKVFVQMCLVMELCSLETLNEFAETTSLTNIAKIDLILQSALGVRHLHHLKPNPITHRDLKPNNILLSGTEESPTIKIADFGEAKFIDRVQDKSQTLHTIRGTRSYWAPELFSLSEDSENPSYGKSVDVFSLAVSSLALLEMQEGSKMVARTGKLMITHSSIAARGIFFFTLKT